MGSHHTILQYILNEIVWGKGVYFLFMLIPLGNLVWMVATYIKLAHSFNKGTGYGVDFELE